MGLLDGEPEGTVVLADSPYGTAALRAELEDRNMQAVIKPPPLRTAIAGGYSLNDFDINTQQRTVTYSGTDRHAHPQPLRPLRQQTPKLPRARTLHHRQNRAQHPATPHHNLLTTARATTRTRGFYHAYTKHRPIAERSIAHLAPNNRKCPYIGTHKNRRWLKQRAAATNLTRLTNLGLHHNGTNWAIT